ncbi:cytochrome c [Marivita sp. XM-24bin2]|jgi:mono/diheme cytochrome c family protein|uniref:c-type cytochrome n=1 Tax=unclassified Marivita TaxID=2632480 RepID=UPI000D7ADBA4|nr:cytochrome c [Marivita sp. XM-24bin2]MCR9110655.1 cytochrome c [Paracoccaceae bacterium]PWL34007.1 MAG: cytochrome C [Marivita sp. XM-24bin2]
MRRVLACLCLFGLTAAPVMAQDVGQGRALFQTHCATCHGADAKGQGPLAGALVLQPVDLTALAVRNGGDFPLQRVLKRIDGTDPLVSHGSPMPVYGPYFEGVANTPMKLPSGQPVLVSEPIADLVGYLQSVQAAE